MDLSIGTSGTSSLQQMAMPRHVSMGHLPNAVSSRPSKTMTQYFEDINEGDGEEEDGGIFF
jgi:hypothetical protein